MCFDVKWMGIFEEAFGRPTFDTTNLDWVVQYDIYTFRFSQAYGHH